MIEGFVLGVIMTLLAGALVAWLEPHWPEDPLREARERARDRQALERDWESRQ